MNLVAPMLARWHLSGRIDQHSASQRSLVREATDLWKGSVRGFTSAMVPFWPLPLRHSHETQLLADEWACEAKPATTPFSARIGLMRQRRLSTFRSALFS